MGVACMIHHRWVAQERRATTSKEARAPLLAPCKRQRKMITHASEGGAQNCTFSPMIEFCCNFAHSLNELAVSWKRE